MDEKGNMSKWEVVFYVLGYVLLLIVFTHLMKYHDCTKWWPHGHWIGRP